MLKILLPEEASNTYQGHKLTKYFLYFYVFKSFFAGCVHMFAADGGAQSIGSVALDTFTKGGADSFITMFGMWGMEQFVIGLIALVILWKYKSLIPMLWAVYAIEYTGRVLIPHFKPGLVTAHTPPGAVMDTVLVPLAILMFIIALYTTKRATKDGF